MNKYAQVAINTVNSYSKISNVNVDIVWTQEAEKMFGVGTSSSQKGCPKGAFLGLCEDGLIKGIPLASYTKSIKNKEYAKKALEILKDNEGKKITPSELWELIGNTGKSHNAQMDVVIELFLAGYTV